MASAKKKTDPITDRSRALNDQIAALEAEIKKLDTQLQRAPVPKLRSTAIPHGATVARKPASADEAPARRKPEPPPAPKPVVHEPVFEEFNKKPFPARNEIETPDHYNKLGARKYDLPELWNRLRNHFRRPTTNNPRLVNYLAAGGVQGLRPLRYEKRVARNRFILLVVFLFLLLLGVLSIFVRNH